MPVFIGCVTLLGPQLSNGELKKEEMTIAIPQELMTEFINDTLPIKIERKTSFSGVIWIESIDRLKLGNDKISFSVDMHGENIGYKRKIGKRPMELEFGDAFFFRLNSLRRSRLTSFLQLGQYSFFLPVFLSRNASGSFCWQWLQRNLL